AGAAVFSRTWRRKLRTGCLQPRLVNEMVLFPLPFGVAEYAQILPREPGHAGPDGHGAAFALFGGIETVHLHSVFPGPLADVRDGHIGDLGILPVRKIELLF